jgi:hypothetical protein
VDVDANILPQRRRTSGVATRGGGNPSQARFKIAVPGPLRCCTGPGISAVSPVAVARDCGPPLRGLSPDRRLWLVSHLCPIAGTVDRTDAIACAASAREVWSRQPSPFGAAEVEFPIQHDGQYRVIRVPAIWATLDV